MNAKELIVAVRSAVYTLINDKGYAAPVDVLMAVGVLSKADYENWRNGRVDFLERVCKVNLKKLSAINHEIRVCAKNQNLKASWTDYREWCKGRKIRPRFSKSGNERIERLYATHYVSQTKDVSQAKADAAKAQEETKAAK
jgi:hypothetical protein